jgi:hypothetical protein
MTPAEILDKAADIIVVRGWHQGGYVPAGVDTRTCQVCVLGALHVAAGEAPDSSYHDSIEEAAEAFAEHLGLFLDEALGDELGDDPIAAVIGNDWNDKTATSADQVTTELRACAANLRTAATP